MQTLIRLSAGAFLSAIGISGLAQPPTLEFDSESYFHRSSEGDQHEFTPEGQDDLARWTDMLSIIFFPTVHDGEALAGVANNVVGLYQSNGTILSTSSVPATENSEAEYLVVAILGYGPALEVVFARILLSNGQGTAVVYSKRFGEAAEEAVVSAWFEESADRKVDAIMSLSGLPEASAFGD